MSDQLGGSEAALLQIIASVRSARPSWDLHVILPGAGPLLAKATATGATCAVVPLPARLAKIGESAAVRDEWGPKSSAALALQLCAGMVTAPAYERALRGALDRFGPDIVHSNGFKSHVFASRVKSPRERLVWHLHEYVGSRRVTRMLLRMQSHRCDAIVTNSHSVAADLRAAIHDGPPIHPIHNAIDLDVFSPEGDRVNLDALAAFPHTATPVVRAGLVATFSRWKGHDIFVQALARAAARVPNLRGYIIGAPLYDTSGSQHSRETVRAMIRDAGIDDRCGMTGFLEPASAIRSLDIVVHASTEPEPFGLVIAEAMACGRALITTGQGGAGELIEPGVDALVVSPSDADSLADALVELALDPVRREQIAARARLSAQARFPPARLGSALVALYESLAPATRNAPARSA